MEELQRFESLSLTDVVPFEHLTALNKKFYRMKSRRYSTKTLETEQNMSRALESVHRWKSQVHEAVFGPFLLKTRKCMKGGGGHLVRHRTCVSLEQLAEIVDRAGSALSLEALFGGVLAVLYGGGKLASFAKCKRELICVNRVLVFEKNVRVVFVESEFTDERFCHSLEDQDRTSSITRASSVERCVEREQRVHASLEFEA